MVDPARTRRRVNSVSLRRSSYQRDTGLSFIARHRGKLLVLVSAMVLLPFSEPPATAMGSRPSATSVSTRLLSSNPETLLAQSLLDIQNNRLDLALKQIDALLSIAPHFRLAHLIKGDLLSARARPLETMGSVSAPAGQISDLRDEARVRLQHYLEPAPLDKVPEYLLQFDSKQSHAIVVDTNKSRLYVYKNDRGEPRYVADYYITSGKNGAEKLKEGDQRTPLGVYFVVNNLPKQKLSDFYGAGAYPLDYPNAWDKRLGKNGHGIWLHGVPRDTYSRPPRASNGCVVLANEDLKVVEPYLDVGHTPVIITNDIAWIDRSTWKAQRADLDHALEAWRHDWESLNTERYLSHYSSDFASGNQNFAAWAAQKRAVNAGKTQVKVTLENVSIFRYPGKENLMVVSFEQNYHSNNLSNQMRKRQYWLQDGKNWKIIYEGAA